MTAANFFPEWAGLASLVLIVNNFLSYSGMEMNAVHVSSLKDPAKEYPKSMFLAMGLVLLIFILPALAISWIVPAEELSLTAGVMQAFDAVLASFNLQAPHADPRHHAGRCLPRRHADVAGRSVQRPAADLA